VPNSSLVLSTDQNDDVVRVIDVNTKTITKVIALPDGANPVGVAVNADGTLAAVAESGPGKVAILDLKTFAVTKEIATDAGASSVAIAGTKAVVVNRDADSVSIVDLGSGALVKTLAVGRGPMSVAADANRAAVTNQNDGTISLIDIGGASITKTIALGDGSVRPQGIAMIPGAGVAFVTAPASGPNGSALLVNLTSGAATTLDANPERSGGATDVAYYNGKVYFANQTGGSVSVLPVTSAGAAAGPIVAVKVDTGARALAIDVKDKVLVVSSEGTGMLVLVSLESNQVVGRINGVRSGDDDSDDDRSDRDRASNMPSVTAIAPATGKAGATVSLLITGTNLAGATEVSFGPEHGNPNGKRDDDGFTVKSIVASADGKQVGCSVTIDASVKPGVRIVRVKTPNGESSWKSDAAVFTVAP
jgi:DNA-binding beta-propeller fold protein YncE